MMKRLTAFLTLCLLLLGLAGCKKEEYSFAIKVGELEVSENDYYRNVMLLRNNYLAAEQATDSKEFWGKTDSAGTTHSKAFTEALKDYLIEAKLYASQFDKLGLALSEEEDAHIRQTLSEQVEAAGGMSAFTASIEKSYYTYDEFVREIYDSAKMRKVLDHYFGEKGERPLSNQDIKDYYNVHNARVHIAYVLTIDNSTGEPLDEAGQKAAKEKAQAAYEAAIRPSDSDTFGDVIEIFSAVNDKNGNETIISDTNYEEKIYKPILELEVGEVALLETEIGYMIAKRYDGTADDFFTVSMKYDTLTTIRAQEIELLLTQWKEDFKITVNHDMISKHAPENYVKN